MACHKFQALMHCTYLINSVTSWCIGRLIGSPRQKSRVQDPLSTINIHEGGHNFQNPTRCGVFIALTNSCEFRHAKDVKTLELRVMN
jgi:hypothetical protein